MQCKRLAHGFTKKHVQIPKEASFHCKGKKNTKNKVSLQETEVGLFSENSQSKDSTVENMKSRFIDREILLRVRDSRS